MLDAGYWCAGLLLHWGRQQLLNAWRQHVASHLFTPIPPLSIASSVWLGSGLQ